MSKCQNVGGGIAYSCWWGNPWQCWWGTTRNRYNIKYRCALIIAFQKMHSLRSNLLRRVQQQIHNNSVQVARGGSEKLVSSNEPRHSQGQEKRWPSTYMLREKRKHKYFNKGRLPTGKNLPIKNMNIANICFPPKYPKNKFRKENNKWLLSLNHQKRDFPNTNNRSKLSRNHQKCFRSIFDDFVFFFVS